MTTITLSIMQDYPSPKKLGKGISQMTSREIAELTGKQHKHVLRDCDILNENYDKMSLLKIEQWYYNAENNQE